MVADELPLIRRINNTLLREVISTLNHPPDVASYGDLTGVTLVRKNMFRARQNVMRLASLVLSRLP